MTNILAMRSDPAYTAAVDEVTAKYDADILVCCCNLFSPSDVRILAEIRKRKQKRKNLLIILTTPGGLADSAYRIGRGIQHHYKTLDPQPDQRGKFYLFIPRWCKSAGTLLALGADGLVMSQMAELGPIDAQLRKEDEVRDWTSGLTAIEALTTLQEKAASLFLKQFKEMRFARETRFSTRMATDIAARITTGLLDPIYAQIDPMRLGEIERFVRIAVEYGDRLATDNVRDGTVVRLVVGYPSHGFIIDQREAKDLFRRVEEPSEALERIGTVAHAEALKSGVMSDETTEPLISFQNQEIGYAKKKAGLAGRRDGSRARGSRKTKAKRKVGPSAGTANTTAVVVRGNGAQKAP
jgi:hypothetical protein